MNENRQLATQAIHTGEPVTVIYHSADYDGIFSREIARKFLPQATLVGWNFGEPKIPMPEKGQVFIIDLPPDALAEVPEFTAHCDRIVWIDHHKTSIDKWSPSIPGYRIDGVAACRLAWQWFYLHQGLSIGSVPPLPDKTDFVERLVSEPLAVRLAGEYDIWDKRDPRAETFQYGLRTADMNLDRWRGLLDLDEMAERSVTTILEIGGWAQSYAQKVDADLVTYRSYRLQWEGLNFLVLNTGRFNSLTFAALDKPETGHDALLGYMFNGRHWTVSLYQANHRKDIDLSVIAKKHGGGGHRGACGFECEVLPFSK